MNTCLWLSLRDWRHSSFVRWPASAQIYTEHIRIRLTCQISYSRVMATISETVPVRMVGPQIPVPLEV